ncbi:MAG TPA: hypothetical protein VFF73_02320 [Planctomycetota bacterium]|nr:hypothetical protein [Planctomycetota bacterium]
MQRALLVLGLLLIIAACGAEHPWYRIDEYPAISLKPVLDFELASVAEEYSSAGAPPRMLKFNDQLSVGCGYCHRENDPRTGDLTAAGTATRRDMDISDRFKVECDYCHAGSPDQFTRPGKFAYRDLHLADRRWKCASCHDLGFRLTRTR